MSGQALARRLVKTRMMFVGTALSVAVLVFLQAFLTGLHDRVIYNGVRFGLGHVAAWWELRDPNEQHIVDDVRSLPEVEAAAIRTVRPGILFRGDSRPVAVDLYGIDPAVEKDFGVAPGWAEDGRFDPGVEEVVLGHYVARVLNVQVGDRVDLWLTADARKSLGVVGILDTSLSGNPHIALTALEPVDGVALELAILLKSAAYTDDVASQLRDMVPSPASVETWEDYLGTLLELVQISKAAAILTTIFVAFILAFGIGSVTFISVAERTREFGILKTVGVAPWWISFLVISETVLLVGVAAVGGVVTGVCAVWGVAWAGGLDLSSLFYYAPFFATSGVVVPDLSVGAILLPLCATVLSGLIASFLPARRASRISVVEALRSL